jgi:Glyoxalase-like domain
MARLHDVVIDCKHPARLARFWAEVLDGYRVVPYDEAEMANLAANGIFDPEDDPSVLVEAPGVHPRFFFQLVPEAKRTKNRVHLDLRCDDVPSEIARLTALGASVALDQPNPTLTVLTDPEGNEFCILH